MEGRFGNCCLSATWDGRAASPPMGLVSALKIIQHAGKKSPPREKRVAVRARSRPVAAVCRHGSSAGSLDYAATKGVNNKIRDLISQAYGYRDYKYMKLKIYELPSMKLTKKMLSASLK